MNNCIIILFCLFCLFYSDQQASNFEARNREDRERPVGMSPVFNRERDYSDYTRSPLNDITRSTIPLSNIMGSTSNISAPESFYSARSRQEFSSDDEDYSVPAPRGFRVRNRLGDSSFWTKSPASMSTPLSHISETPELVFQNTDQGMSMQVKRSDDTMRSSNDSNSTFGSRSSYSVTQNYEQVIAKLDAEDRAKNTKAGPFSTIRKDATFTIQAGDSSYVSGTPNSDLSMDFIRKRGYSTSMAHRGNSVGASNTEDYDSFDLSMTTPFRPMLRDPRVGASNGLFMGPPGFTPAPRPLPKAILPLMNQLEEDKENQDAAKPERPKTLNIESRGVRFKESNL